MKTLILLATLLISISSFAGDAYLICHDRDGEYVTDAWIDFHTRVTKVEFNDMFTDRYSFEVSYNFDQRSIDYKVYEMNSGFLMEEGSQKVDFYDEVKLVSGYICSLVD